MSRIKTIEDLNSMKAPIVRIDNSLKKYKDLPVFQKKLDMANEMLQKYGVPDAYWKSQTKTKIKT